MYILELLCYAEFAHNTEAR